MKIWIRLKLLGGSVIIRANLLYAKPDAGERELVEVCEAARIWDVISSLPDGLYTVLGDRGYRLSGGEKPPPIVVLDDATAHLDAKSEAAV